MTRGKEEFRKNWDEFQKDRKWLYASVPIIEDPELSAQAKILFMVLNSYCGAYGIFHATNEVLSKKGAVLITDKDGNQIRFHPITETKKGIQGIYTISGKLYRSTVCFIKGVKCKAEEISLGNIIIRPVSLSKSKA